MEKVRIFLVDDHQMFRDALRSLLEREPGLQVVGETGDAFEVIGLVRKTSADIVCMDIGMPGMNGIEITRHLIAAFPLIRVVALSTHSDQRYVSDMMNAGACAYVTKAEAADELLRAISAVLDNRKYLCPDVLNAMSQQTFTPVKLGSREWQVLQLVAKGLTSAVIGDRLNIAPSTVDVHRRNIMKKLNLHTVADLTRYAINCALISD
jgi:DNA-binding NarL/FixJ family response regulator